MRSQLLRSVVFVLGVVFAYASSANDGKEGIVEFTVQEKIGTAQVPVINVEVNVNKTRDLHVVFKEAKSGKKIKSTFKRIKKSGSYYFKVKVGNLSPGRYQWSAYLAPRKKNWNDRLGEPVNQIMQVVNAEKFEQKAVKKQTKKVVRNNVKKKDFAKKDGFKKIDWPKNISTNDELILTVQYLVTQERDIHLKLLSSKDWEEHGALKVNVKENGKFSLPFSSMLENYGPGKYVWVMSITEVGNPDKILKKQGRHFVISQPEK